MSSALAGRSQDGDVKGLRFSLSGRLQIALITIVNVISFAVVWELVTTYGGVPRLFLPKLSAILADVPQMYQEGILLPNLWVSVSNYTIGLLIGVALALPFSFAIGGIKIVDRVFSPFLWALYSTPRIVLLPLVFLWFGITNEARLVMIIISVFPSMTVVVMEGIKTTEGGLLRVARSFGANRWKLLRHVLIPATMPYIGTGLRMGMVRGLIGLYVGELFITASGLGAILSYARIRFNTPRVFAVLFIFIAFAISTMAISRFLEARASQWRAEVKL